MALLQVLNIYGTVSYRWDLGYLKTNKHDRVGHQGIVERTIRDGRGFIVEMLSHLLDCRREGETGECYVGVDEVFEFQVVLWLGVGLLR